MRYAPDNHFRELFKRHDANPILTCLDWPYPVNSVFQPRAVMVSGQCLLLARVEDRRGFSHLCAARSPSGLYEWEPDESPTLAPRPEEYPEETWGIEDPRVTWMEDLGFWVVAYTAYSEVGPLVSLATTEDFVNFRRLGPVMPPRTRMPLFFRSSSRQVCDAAQTCACDGRGRKAHLDIFSPDLKHWGDHQLLLPARRGGWWDANKIGVSTPPLRTPEGWLILYHGVAETVAGCIYRLGVALLDLEDPTVVLRRSPEWIFGPKTQYERTGDVDDVVFACGWVVNDDEIRLYYGCADTCIALATGKLSHLLEYVTGCPEGNGRD